MSRVCVRAVLALCVAFAVPAVSAQQTPQPVASGAITGIVVDGVSGAPVADVVVSLSGVPLPTGYQARLVSDARGRFAFQNLPDGQAFVLSAGKLGYLDGGYGRDSGPLDELRPITIAGGAWVPNLRVTMWRPGTISGTVRDETGEPVVGVFVRALARIRIAGRDDVAAGPITVTDDHGEYRIIGLHPGRYLVQVPSVQMSLPAGTRISGASSNMPDGAVDVDDTARLMIGRYPLPPAAVGGRTMSYGPALHPSGSNVASASVVDVAFGDDRRSIDVTLTPVPAVRVSGAVEGPPEALTGLTVRLVPAGFESLGLGSEAATALVGANGAFTFLNVPAGTYTLDAPSKFAEFRIASGAMSTGGSVGSSNRASFPSPPPRSGSSSQGQYLSSVAGLMLQTTDYRGGNSPAFSGRTAVTVGSSNVSGLTLQVRPHLTMRGRVVVETDPAKPAPSPLPRAYLLLDPAGGQPSLGLPGASAAAAGTSDFEIANVRPGEYWLRIQTFGTNWAIKSVQWRGRDYTRTPIDTTTSDDLSGMVVTMTNAVPTLTGAVRSQEGAAPDAGIVIVFPALAAERSPTGLLPNRMKAMPLNSSGRFTFGDLPAGDYLLAAVGRSSMATWRDPAFIATIERQAVRVTLNWGQTTNQDLTMVIK